MVSCGSSAPTASSPTSSAAAQSHSTPNPSAGPVANKSCPAANSQISTDQAIDALAASHTASSAQHALQTFLDQYHMTVLVTQTWETFMGNIYWDNLNDNDLPALISFGTLLICEYAKYSERWVNSSRIRSVALVKNLRVQPTAAPCLAIGLADINEMTVYHSVECKAYMGAVQDKRDMHHEFWHLMASSMNRWDDPAWSALNDPNFAYGNDGYDPVTGQGPKTCDRHAVPGFVTCYARHNANEDQAETYASLFVEEEYKLLVAWMATDPVLKSKVEYLRQFITSRDPAMNDYFARSSA
jgi:putative zinc-binding metallo-peptidase